MRKIYFILMLILITSGAFAQEGRIDDNLVILKYNNAINGLKVEAIWKPNELRNDYVIGPAIIQFTNIKYGTKSTVVNNNFGILEKRLSEFIKWSKDEDGAHKIQDIVNKSINLDYKKPKIAEDKYTFGTTDEPFFFYDIDFDGEKELVVSEMFIGQRFRSTFKVYKISRNQDIEVLEDDFHQITYQEPYIFLDEASTVNRSNKTIEISSSSGAADSTSEIYQLPLSEDGR